MDTGQQEIKIINMKLETLYKRAKTGKIVSYYIRVEDNGTMNQTFHFVVKKRCLKKRTNLFLLKGLHIDISKKQMDYI